MQSGAVQRPALRSQPSTSHHLHADSPSPASDSLHLAMPKRYSITIPFQPSHPSHYCVSQSPEQVPNTLAYIPIQPVPATKKYRWQQKYCYCEMHARSRMQDPYDLFLLFLHLDFKQLDITLQPQKKRCKAGESSFTIARSQALGRSQQKLMRCHALPHSAYPMCHKGSILSAYLQRLPTDERSRRFIPLDLSVGFSPSPRYPQASPPEQPLQLKKPSSLFQPKPKAHRPHEQTSKMSNAPIFSAPKHVQNKIKQAHVDVLTTPQPRNDILRHAKQTTNPSPSFLHRILLVVKH
ncbi:hypothetical protein DL98DRAFT_524658 [Cadophora sp. DSE1049]|nr:hypothetical protein DL98DRAFT_524658 [Cadophora sp. DSE1049]